MNTSHGPDDLDRYRWLLSPSGTAILNRIQEMRDQGDASIRISERLRAEAESEHVALAMTQHELRSTASAKFVNAAQLFFTREGLEQATTETIARHRARRFHGLPSLVDLCCGIGGDLLALARLDGIENLGGVDLDPVHLLLARANTQTVAPGIQPDLIQADVQDVNLARFQAIFIDPARRDAGGRLGGSTSEPPLEWALSLASTVPAVGIKTAPGLPHRLIPEGWELETIALGPDLKEAVLWSPVLAQGSRTATVMVDGVAHQVRHIPGDRIPVHQPEPGQWLLDPNPAITRAGLVEDLARHLNAVKIDDDIAFLTADQSTGSPFARSLPIIDAMPWHEKRLKARLRALGAGPVDIRRRGLAGDVDRITKRLRGKGDRRLVIAMTRVQGEPWAIICNVE